MSGRGRGRNIPVDESNPDSNASIAQLLRLLVYQQGRGNGQSFSSRGPSNDDTQERFRRHKPREFSGTTDPFVAESWIKSMEIKMSGRGRGRNIPVDESNPDSNASIAQLLRLLVYQQGRGNGQSSSSRGPSNDDPQERFLRQKPREFSGTTDPFVAESWIKSMEVIFEYLQTPDLERSICAIYMLRDDAMLWWEGAKLTVEFCALLILELQ
ncbi:hypothetical protein F511_19920 [Dorcoceras hygrometricum]|uniref:Uncharacterized protein n=1 Tax=Dorcoceras hygrometricum TaxID=472368 RepID=A0A2Z7BW21_9LAMI|nr:hypothetical protein F511_19920 [Dorcoceras hygrometricum]